MFLGIGILIRNDSIICFFSLLIKDAMNDSIVSVKEFSEKESTMPRQTKTKPAPAAAPGPIPSNAAKATAKQLRSQLASELRDFVKEAKIAEIYFAKDVMCNWESCCCGEELGIASAFATAIDNRCREYVRVPEKYAAAVKRYIERLESGEIILDPESGPSTYSPAVEPAVSLPSNVRLSEDERAYVARLVRLLRENYWVSDLVRHILDKESKGRHRITLKYLRALLDNFDTIEALASNAKQLGQSWSSHPIMRAIREEWPDIQEYKDERAIQRLIDSAGKADPAR